ncbi:MAG TPA: kelch repeat-containing protein, partial [Verrucomicrobiae bacterium]|nr:kelch repeat-containing protein [Verrucomicrobiae bacterium]
MARAFVVGTLGILLTGIALSTACSGGGVSPHTQKTLTSISVTPGTPTISSGSTQPFTATGHYSDGSNQDVTTTANWTSSQTSVATISNSSGTQGLATGVGAGSSLITAAVGSVNGSTTLTVTSSASSSAWNQDGPVARFSHSGVFDDTTKQMIVFGGVDTATGGSLDDLWLISTGTDRHLRAMSMTSSTASPSARFGHSAIYDSANNVMTVFGGGSSLTNCSNDVWVLDGANGANGNPSWLPVSASGTLPVHRMWHNAVYDAGSNTMIVFGGSDCNGGYLNDVWVLSNANGQGGTPHWTKLSPTGTAPSAREASSAIYDEANNVLVIYGGDAGGSAL